MYVVLLAQELVHRKYQKTVALAGIRGGFSPNIWKPLLLSPTCWECHPGTLDGIPDGCPGVGSSNAHPPPAPVWAENGTRQQSSLPLHPTSDHQWDATYSDRAAAPDSKQKAPHCQPSSLPASVPQAAGSPSPLAAFPHSCLTAFVRHVNFHVSPAPCTGSNQGS